MESWAREALKRLNRRKPKKRKIIITVKLDEDMVKELDTCRTKKGLEHRSEIIREALKMYLEVQGCDMA